MVTSMLVGKRLGDFILVEILGRGPMATMFRARQIESGEVVVLKVYPASLIEEYIGFHESFDKDAEKLKSLTHPHILPIKEIRREDERLFLILPYISNGSLEEKLGAKTHLSHEEVLRIAGAVSGALDAAHAAKILHRNLAPSNILLDDKDGVFLSDFDIPCVRKAVTHITGSGMVGKSAYAAPEIANGEPPISERTDIYALGVVVFQMLTGKTPFVAETPIKQIMMHLTQPVPSVSQQNPEYGIAVDAVISRAMAKEPKNRFASAGEFFTALKEAIKMGDDLPPVSTMLISSDASDDKSPETNPFAESPLTPLGRYFDEEPAGSKPPAMPPKPPKGSTPESAGQKLPWYVVLAILCFLILSWGAVGMMLGGEYKVQSDYATEVAGYATATQQVILSTIEAQETAAAGAVINLTSTQSALENAMTAVAAATEQPATAVPTPTATLMPTPTPRGGSGGRIALLSDQSGSVEVYTLDIDALEYTRITENDNVENHPTFSPDGRFLAFQMEEPLTGTHIMVADTTTGEIRNLTEGIRTNTYPLWSEDGSRVLYLHDEGRYTYFRTMPLVPETLEDDEETLNQLPLGEITPFRWRMAEGLLEYLDIGFEEAFEVIQMELTTGETNQMTRLRGAVTWVDYSPDGQKAIYSVLLLSTGRSHLLLADANCDEMLTLETCNAVVLTSPDFNYYKPRFSPDGQMILAVSDRSGNMDIWLLNLEGKAVLQLTDLPSSETEAVWQPYP